jgi:serine/threonine protein kinase/Flp pilus assembly protein TadD
MSDLHKSLGDLFNAAVELPASERAAFLDRAGTEEPQLRQRLEELLAAHDRAGGFLQAPAADPAAGGTVRLSLPMEENAGQSIGRYKLLQQIGEGGCGVVYMAEQQEPFKRRVALKVIKLGMDTRQVIARFEAERQALALMDHPNIAKVLDAGATEAGRPFFVMELVRGIKVTDYCDQNNLSTEERLELFSLVCQAIQHAHQKGIIHRDIKPSNILVTMHDGVPVPKVIDFGIAKATTGQRLTDKTLFTAFEQFIGTPAYMSPEQAEMSGMDIDTRSDIYALGVLLYELLTGKTPFDAKELVASGLEAMRRTIREREPARPSTRLNTMVESDLTSVAKHRRVEPSKLTTLIRGDLDWIVMKSLEKDRTRRYETANGLSMDVQRFLRNEPVVARPPNRLYRLQKSVLRNKLIFAAGTAVVMALLVGLAISTRSLWSEKQARQRALAAAKVAELEAAKSEQMAHLLQDMLARVSSQVAEARDTKALLKILDQTTKRFQSELRDQPAVESQLRRILGRICFDLGDFASAVTMNQEAIRLAEFAGEEKSKAVAQLYDDLGLALGERGDFDRAETAYKKSLELKKIHFGEASAEYADPLVNLGLTLWMRGDLGEAEMVIQRALELKRRFPGDKKDLAATINNLGLILWEQGRMDEAEPYLVESHGLAVALLGDHPEVAYSTYNLASVYRDRGDLARAEQLQREALRLLPDGHPFSLRARTSLSATIRRRASLSGDEAALREALQLDPNNPLTMDCLASLFALKSCSVLAASAGWRATTKQPPSDWNQPDFQDDFWDLAASVSGQPRFAPYSQRIDRSVRFHTNLWLRREFELSPKADAHVVLRLNRCQNAQVFINGVAAAASMDWTDGVVVAPMLPAGKAALRPGTNLLAIHCLDADGGTTVDVQILQSQDPSLGLSRLVAELDALTPVASQQVEVFAARGSARARSGEWRGAAKDLDQALTLAPQSVALWYQQAPLWLALGQKSDYERHRRVALNSLVAPNTPTEGAQVAILALLSPIEIAELQAVTPLIERAAGATYPDKGLVQRQFAKGLYEYRCGHPTAAVEWMQKVQHTASQRDITGWTFERERNRTAAACLVEALALQQLSDPELARAALTNALRFIQRELPGVDADPGREWQEWLIVRILQAEAERSDRILVTLVRPKPSRTVSTTPAPHHE